jgi:hypothetical protein
MIVRFGTYICVKSESRSQPNREVREQPHEKTGQCRDCSSSGNEITMDLVYAEEIRSICRTAITRRAHASAARVGNNRGIDRNLRGQGDIVRVATPVHVAFIIVDGQCMPLQPASV